MPGHNFGMKFMSTDLSTLRRQLQQLKELHDTGVVSAVQFEESRAPLERKIVELVMAGATEVPAIAATSPAVQPAAKKASPWLLVGLAIIVVAIAAAGYYWSGSTELLKGGPAPEVAADAGGAPDGKAHDTNAAQIAKMVDGLAEKLKANPNDAMGWGMLARSYVVLGRNDDAVSAYQKAMKLTPNDASLLADYADALGVKNNRTLVGEPLKLIEKALQLETNNPKALSLAGTAAFDRQDFPGAVKYWEKLIQVGPKDPNFQQQVKSSIDEARQLGKMPASKLTLVSEAPAPSATVPGASVSGRVTLNAALAKQANPDDTVFISARAVEGSPMPLAIVRKQVKDLPFDFALDDSMSMSPAAKLSNVQKVIVVARISKSGQAMPQPGDLRGQSEPVSVGSSKLKIEISELMK
jgi:cytochrome c-type biogenesis protein CcmH